MKSPTPLRAVLSLPSRPVPGSSTSTALLRRAFFSVSARDDVAAHFFVGIDLQQHLRRHRDVQFAQRAHGENEERDARFHVEHARSPQPALRFAERHGAQRAQRPDRVGMAERQNLAALLPSRAASIRSSGAGRSVRPAGSSTWPKGAAASASSSTKRLTAAGSSLGDSHSTNCRISATISLLPRAERTESMESTAVIIAASMPILDINEIREILPHRYPFLLVDRIVELEAERIVGHQERHRQRAVLPGPFSGFPGDAGRADRGSHGADGRRAGAEEHAGPAATSWCCWRPSRTRSSAGRWCPATAAHGDEGDQAQGQRGQDGRHRHRGWRGGGRGRSDVQAGRQGREAAPSTLERCRFIRPPSSTRRRASPKPPRSDLIAIIGAEVEIGARTRLMAHVYLEGPTWIGEDNIFFPYQHRRRGVAGSEVQGRARRDAHRQPQPDPRIRHHPSRHRGRRPGHQHRQRQPADGLRPRGARCARSATTSFWATAWLWPAT